MQVETVQVTSQALEIARLSAVAALVAAILGPVATVVATWRQTVAHLAAVERQVHADTVSLSRREWIDTLRTTLAEFVSVIHLISADYAVRPMPMNEKISAHASLVRHLAMTKLLLNPHDPDHQLLLREMAEAMNFDYSSAQAMANVRHAVARVTTLAQDILKGEWEQVKSGS